MNKSIDTGYKMKQLSVEENRKFFEKIASKDNKDKEIEVPIEIYKLFSTDPKKAEEELDKIEQQFINSYKMNQKPFNNVTSYDRSATDYIVGGTSTDKSGSLQDKSIEYEDDNQMFLNTGYNIKQLSVEENRKFFEKVASKDNKDKEIEIPIEIYKLFSTDPKKAEEELDKIEEQFINSYKKS